MLPNKPCPKCREQGRDDKGDNLFLLSNKKGYACRQNGVTHPPYYEWFDKMPVEASISSQEARSKVTLGDVLSFPFRALEERLIKSSTCEKFGVRVGVSEEIGETTEHYYPFTKDGKICGYKVRKLPKEFFSIGDSRGEVDLFGQWAMPKGGKKILIVGGELDALSAYQMFKESKYTTNVSVVSLPKGEGDIASIKSNLDFLKGYEEVIIYTDMDEPGRKAAENIAKLLGPKSKIMVTSEKDASDMLTKGKQSEFISSFFSAEIRRPDGIVSGSNLSLSKIMVRTNEGYDLPYPNLSKMLGGLRKGEITTLTAGSGIGKSTLAREFGYHLRCVHDLCVGNIFLEEPLNKTIQGYIAIDNNIPLSALRKNPDLLTESQWQASYDRLISSKWFGLEHFGSLPTEDLLDKMRHLAYGEGCDFVILDHLSMVFSGQQNENERMAIDNAMTELAAFCNESGVGVIVVVHLSRNKVKGSFNDGAQISLSDMRGSAALEQLSWNVIGLERSQQGEEQNIATMRILKNRENGWTGVADTCEYSFETGRLLPITVQLSGGF